MKLEVGSYIRTKSGQIGKIKTIGKDNIAIEFNRMWCDIVHKKNIVKESNFNIIDLIEEGDYINGLRVEKNKYGELYTSYVYYGGDIGKQCEVYTNWLKELKEGMIYNIVTKEQFEEIKYMVNE